MENRKKIVVLDGYTLCAGELNFDALREFGEVTVYDRVAQEDVAARIGDAQIVLTNKALITAEVMDACPQMEYVGVTATGYNIVDVAEAKRHKIQQSDRQTNCERKTTMAAHRAHAAEQTGNRSDQQQCAHQTGVKCIHARSPP